MRSAGGAIERLCRVSAKRADPEQLGFARMRHEGDLVALWRKHGHAASVASSVHGKLVWRRNFGVKRKWRFGGFCPAVSGESGKGDESDKSGGQSGSPGFVELGGRLCGAG